jgi:ABC-2 type transport system permease protein
VTRIRAILAKEFLDLARNRGALVPVAIVTLLSLALPFVLVLGIPRMTGEPLASDADLIHVSAVAGINPQLSGEAQIQFFLFQQFLMLFLLTPITGAMALAAHSVVGEKQARTLEPLLATPISTVELLVGKVLGALLPTLAISAIGLFIYFIGIGWLGESGVVEAMATMRTALLIGAIGPAAALVSLQAAIVVSSRVNDARTAQQFGVLIIIPLTALLVAQFTGSLWLSTTMLSTIGVGLLVMWIVLTIVSAALFDRETILTRWR